MVDMNVSSKHANYYTSTVNKVESDAKTTEKTIEAEDKVWYMKSRTCEVSHL